MDRSLVIGLVGGAIVAAGAGAVGGYRIAKAPDYAEVLSAKPVTKTIQTPRQACHDETVTHRKDPQDQHQVLGTVAGAIVGGVLGHQIGGGSGRSLATVAGAAAGGYAGNRIQKRVQDKDTYTTTEQMCQTVYHKSEQPAGYEVRYRLDGRVATVRMDHDPGKRIPVRDGELQLDGGARKTTSGS